MSAKQKRSNKPRNNPAGPQAKKDRLMEELSLKGVGDKHISAAMAMMDPGAFPLGSAKIPSRSPWLRNVTVESTVIKLSTANGTVAADGSFSLQARARPDGALVLLGGPGVVDNVFGVNGVAAVNSGQTYNGAPTETAMPQVVLQQNTVSSGARLGTIAAGGSTWVVPFASTAGGTRTVSVSNSTTDIQVKFRPYTGPIGALVANTAATVNVPDKGSSSATLTIPANCTFLEVVYIFCPADMAGKKIQFSFSIQGSALVNIGSEAHTVDLTTLAGVDKLRAYRIVAQSVLLTYTGSALNNGGDIAIARVSSTWSPDPGQSVYEAILKLPSTRRYSGMVKHGAHSFWSPETVEDFEPKLYGEDFDNAEKPTLKIVAAGALDDTGESILLQMQTVVEYQTDSPSYASVEYAPPWDSFDVALHVLARMNPCGENPSHLKKIRKFLEPKVKSMVQYAVENPAAIGAAVAKILPLLL